MIPTTCPHCQQLQFGGLVCTVCGRYLLARDPERPQIPPPAAADDHDHSRFSDDGNPHA